MSDLAAGAHPLTQARARLGELVNRARYGHERILLTEHGNPVAAIISIDDLNELEAARDTADLAAAAAVKANGAPDIPHDKVMAAMDALDAADAAITPEQAAGILAAHADVLDRADVAGQSDPVW